VLDAEEGLGAALFPADEAGLEIAPRSTTGRVPTTRPSRRTVAVSAMAKISVRRCEM
jgi:hypothetical protein